MDRGPPRALHLLGARAAAAAGDHRRLRRRRPDHALDVHIWHDNGAYTPYGIIVPIVTATQLVGPYVIPTYRVIVESVYTNTVIVTPYRGAGRPQGCYAMERTMDRIADALGLDRAVVRERNLIQADQFPYDHHLTFQDGRPVIYDSGDYPGRLDKLKAWSAGRRPRSCGRRPRRAEAARRRHGAVRGGHRARAVRGRARAGARQRQGAGLDRADVAGAGPRDGVRADRRLGARGADRGHRGDHRRHPPLRVRRRHVRLAGRGDERQRDRAGGAGRAEKALRIAADVLEATRATWRSTRAWCRSRTPGASIPLRTVAVLSNPLRYAFDEAAKQATQFATGDDSSRRWRPGMRRAGARDYYSPIRSTFASGAHAAIVEIDPATWEIDVVKYAVVHDCGNVVNPMIVEGQVHGGVAQGVGGALYERMAYDADGQLQNASFMDFLMPYASEVPDIDIDHQMTPSPLNPLGHQGRRRGGVIPGTAAIASAIEDAVGRPDRGDADLPPSCTT